MERRSSVALPSIRRPSSPGASLPRRPSSGHKKPSLARRISFNALPNNEDHGSLSDQGSTKPETVMPADLASLIAKIREQKIKQSPATSMQRFRKAGWAIVEEIKKMKLTLKSLEEEENETPAELPNTKKPSMTKSLSKLPSRRASISNLTTRPTSRQSISANELPKRPGSNNNGGENATQAPKLVIDASVRSKLRILPHLRSEVDVVHIGALLTNIQSIMKYPPPTRHDIAKSALYAAYEKGRIIVRQGHPAQGFYFILSGSVNVDIRMPDLADPGQTISRTVGVLGPGENFGELALLKDINRAATVTTSAPTELICIDKEDFRRILASEQRKLVQEKIKFLKETPLSATWPDDIITRLAETATIKYIAHHEIIVKEGDPSDKVFLVRLGTGIKELRVVEFARKQQRNGSYRLEPVLGASESNAGNKKKIVHIRTLAQGNFFGVECLIEHELTSNHIKESFKEGSVQPRQPNDSGAPNNAWATLQPSTMLSTGKSELYMWSRSEFLRLITPDIYELFKLLVEQRTFPQAKLAAEYRDFLSWSDFKEGVKNEIVGERAVDVLKKAELSRATYIKMFEPL